jgi:hypothetical protein
MSSNRSIWLMYCINLLSGLQCPSSALKVTKISYIKKRIKKTTKKNAKVSRIGYGLVIPQQLNLRRSSDVCQPRFLHTILKGSFCSFIKKFRNNFGQHLGREEFRFSEMMHQQVDLNMTLKTTSLLLPLKLVEVTIIYKAFSQLQIAKMGR